MSTNWYNFLTIKGAANLNVMYSNVHLVDFTTKKTTDSNGRSVLDRRDWKCSFVPNYCSKLTNHDLARWQARQHSLPPDGTVSYVSIFANIFSLFACSCVIRIHVTCTFPAGPALRLYSAQPSSAAAVGSPVLCYLHNENQVSKTRTPDTMVFNYQGLRFPRWVHRYWNVTHILQGLSSLIFKKYFLCRHMKCEDIR